MLMVALSTPPHLHPACNHLTGLYTSAVCPTRTVTISHAGDETNPMEIVVRVIHIRLSTTDQQSASHGQPIQSQQPQSLQHDEDRELTDDVSNAVATAFEAI